MMVLIGIFVVILGLAIVYYGWKKHSEIAWVEGWLVAAIGVITCFH